MVLKHSFEAWKKASLPGHAVNDKGITKEEKKPQNLDHSGNQQDSNGNDGNESWGRPYRSWYREAAALTL